MNTHSPAEIYAFYKKEIAPFFSDLNKSRQAVVRWSIIFFLGAAALIYCQVDKKHVSACLPFGFVAVTLGGWCAQRAYRSYKETFRHLVLMPIVKFFFPTLTYDADIGIPRIMFDLSSLFQERVDLYEGSDLIAGSVNSCEFQASVINARREDRTARNRKIQTVFKGLFFFSDSPKNFSGLTLIRPDIAERVLGIVGRNFQSAFPGGELVEMENPEFEKYFKVESTDQVEARYLISTTLMQRILDFRARTGGRLWLSFSEQKIFIAVSKSGGFFEPRVWGSTPIEFEDLQSFIAQFEFVTNIVSDLRLDQKIWKQAKDHKYPSECKCHERTR